MIEEEMSQEDWSKLLKPRRRRSKPREVDAAAPETPPAEPAPKADAVPPKSSSKAKP